MPLPSKQPVVGIFVDGVTGFGRAVMRGVMRHANLQRKWIIFKELRHVLLPQPYPKLDGAILAGVGPKLATRILDVCPRVVWCSGAADPAESAVVSMDDYAIGATAAEHLLECRLVQFAYFGLEKKSPLSCRRYAGFSDTVKSRGFACCEAGLGWPTQMDQKTPVAWPQTIEWLRRLPKPVGIMAVDDVAANGLAAACLDAGIAVPDEVAIIGVNNDDLMCESAWPPLSSVEADYSRVGYAAAGLMEQMLAGQTLTPEQRLIRLSPRGVARRQSTELLAVNDPYLADAVHFIRLHACDPCTVSDVLKHVPVGRRWLERQFVTQLGRTPHDEIMHVRLENAKRLLLHSDLTVAEVARRCGSSTIQNFCRAFEKSIGQSPGAFRKASRAPAR